MLGGAFLCYEGFEKLAHRLLHSRTEDAQHHAELAQATPGTTVDVAAAETGKIKGAVRTDFILSAEIIVITLNVVAQAPFVTRVGVLAGIALLMTVGVYGLVGSIVKLDDVGLYLSRRAGDTILARTQRGLGAGLLAAAPWLMKGLSVAGTAAMFLVGGGILVHGIPPLHHAIEGLAEGAAALRGLGPLHVVVPLLLNGVTGIVAGGLVLAGVTAARRVVASRTTR
jgi:predicted DNA repair protein MutK